MDISFLLPAILGSAIAGLAAAKNQQGKVLRLTQTSQTFKQPKAVTSA